jgi:hypothetical protein
MDGVGGGGGGGLRSRYGGVPAGPTAPVPPQRSIDRDSPSGMSAAAARMGHMSLTPNSTNGGSMTGGPMHGGGQYGGHMGGGGGGAGGYSDMGGPPSPRSASSDIAFGSNAATPPGGYRWGRAFLLASCDAGLVHNSRECAWLVVWACLFGSVGELAVESVYRPASGQRSTAVGSWQLACGTCLHYAPVH